jgi:hypothetical protein
MRVEGTFESKAIGHARNPAGWVGPGTITLSDQALILDGKVRGSGLPSLCAFLGFAIGIAVSLAIGFQVRRVAAVAIGGLFLGAALGARLARARPRRVEIPWTRMKKPKLANGKLTFLSRAAPRGEVTFAVGDANLADALRGRLASAGVLPAT